MTALIVSALLLWTVLVFCAGYYVAAIRLGAMPERDE